MAKGTRFTVDPDVALVYDLKDQANQERERHHSQWARNKQLEGGDHWTTNPPTGRNHYTLNLIPSVLDITLSIMNEQRPTRNIRPHEINSADLFYIDQSVGRRLAAELEGRRETITGVFTAGDRESPLLTGEPMRKEQARLLVESPDIPVLEEDFQIFNNAEMGKLLDLVVDGIWDWYDWDYLIPEFQRAALVIGHRDVLVEWDEELGDPVLRPILEKDAWIDPDPTVTDIDQANNYTIAQVFDLDEAMAKFPEHAKQIQKNAELVPIDPDGFELSNRYSDIDWRRDKAVLYTTWVRNQKIEGEIALKEIRTINGVKLFSGKSDFPDIPVVRFKNSMKTDQVHPMGIPERLDDAQMMINRLYSNLCDHAKYLPAPQQLITARTAQLLQKHNIDLWSKPNRVMIVPDDLVAEVGGLNNVISFIEPPQLDGSHLILLQKSIDLFFQMADQGDLSRGFTSSQATSGVAIEKLQIAGSRPSTMKSFVMEKPMVRMVKMILWMITRKMDIKKISKYTDVYDDRIIEDAMERAKDYRFVVKVDMSPNRANTKAEEAQKALLLSSQGKISDETLYEKLEVGDPDTEKQKLDKQREEELAFVQQASNNQVAAGGSGGV